MITAKTSLYGLIGNPVDHSVSPLMHNTAFKKLGIDAVYLAFKSENTEDTISALKTLGARGFNCTMPAKSDCAVLCDKLSEEAELTKSVNTVVVEGDKLTGHSTDGAGFFLNLKNNGVDYANLGVETANLIKAILVDGANPAETPVVTFDNGIATVNTDICATLGLDYDAVAETFAPLCTAVQPITTAESFDDVAE